MDIKLTISAISVVSTISPFEIVTIAPIKKGKTTFQPVTTTFFTSAKVPASLSSIYLPRKPSPVKTD